MPTNDLTDVLYGRIMSDDKNILPRRYQSHKARIKKMKQPRSGLLKKQVVSKRRIMMKSLIFPEAQRIWGFALDRYGRRSNGADYYITLRGPFLTDDNREVYRAKTTGTRYQYLVVPEEDAIERFAEYGIGNLDLKSNQLARLVISSYAAQDKVEGRQRYKEIYFAYLIKSVNIMDTKNLALSASLVGPSESEEIIDVHRTKDFPKSQIREHLKTFIVRLCRDRMDNIAPLKWEESQ